MIPFPHQLAAFDKENKSIPSSEKGQDAVKREHVMESED